ncbi:group 1 glycosyl transferase [Achromatium sp. WMS2]|nr:group 1 glycosyl transferase [Achromatium sp. WMS2]
MSVLMVSTSYPENLSAWQGLFIRHLADALGAYPGIKLQLWAPPGEHSKFVADACTIEESMWLKQLLAQGGIAHILRQRNLSSIVQPIKLLLLLRRVYTRHIQDSILHINWLQNALPLYRLRTQQPALISVLGTDMSLLNVPGVRQGLRRVFTQRRCLIAPNADWMTGRLQQLFGDVARIKPVVFGIDPKWYELQRGALAVPSKWLVVSRLTTAKIGPLFAWGAALFGKNRELHLFGPNQESMEIPTWVHYHGPTHPQDLITNWFPQATGLITLSKHAEGRPQIMLEAMAAGLPVIASQQPAHADLIQSAQTGWLVANQESLQTAVEWLENISNNIKIGQQARIWTQQHIGTWDDCAKRYVDAYNQLLELRS